MPTAANYRGFIQNFLSVDAPNSRVASLRVWETEVLSGPADAWMGPLTRVDKS